MNRVMGVTGCKSSAQIFCCQLGSFPIKYLGVSLHYDKLRREDLQPIIDIGERIPAYVMAIIKFPKWVINTINSQMAHFFWENIDDNHKYHLANWGLVSRRKDFGELGVPNIRDFTMALLASCGKKIF